MFRVFSGIQAYVSVLSHGEVYWTDDKHLQIPIAVKKPVLEWVMGIVCQLNF